MLRRISRKFSTISIKCPDPNREYLFGKTTQGLIGELQNKLSLSHQKLLHERTIPKKYGFREDTKFLRGDPWMVKPPNTDIMRRHVEITGPTSDAKMMINALNSSANCYMTDIEDSTSPSWVNIQNAHDNIFEALRGNISYNKKNEHGDIIKTYVLDKTKITPTFFTRLRGLHLVENNIRANDDYPIPATFADFAIYMANNATLIKNKSHSTRGGIYFYVPKIQTYEEAKLINSMFQIGEDYMDIPRGTIRATLLIETFPAIFQTDEIIFALKDYICGLNCGRWDYLFSLIKSNMGMNIPDRNLLTLEQPFMRSYIEQIVQSCHNHGIHAMGGMSAFIPSKNEEQNAVILDKIKKDKIIEMKLGCDGAWVANPDLIPHVQDIFTSYLGKNNNQIQFRTIKTINSREFTNFSSELMMPYNYTEKEFKNNLNISIQYLSAWLYGNGAVALNGLMEDLATCEISLYQIKQWVHNKTSLLKNDGTYFELTHEIFKQYLHDEIENVQSSNQIPYAISRIPITENIIAEYIFDKTKYFLPDIAYPYLSV
jgi:malate synthase